jgi:hypothetical protein
VRSMPMCIYAVGVYTWEIYGGSYRVCLRGVRMDVTYRLEYRVRYIYLISVILNVYGGYGLCYNSLTSCLLYLFLIRISR